MNKVRVYELAKDLDISSKKLVDALKQVGIDVSSHMSTLDEHVAKQIRTVLMGGSVSELGDPESSLSGNTKEEQEDNQQHKSEMNYSQENSVSSEPEMPRQESTEVKQEIVDEVSWLEEQDKKLYKRSKKKRKRNKHSDESRKQTLPNSNKVEIAMPVTVKELADAMGVSSNRIISTLMQLGVMAALNQTIDADIAELVGDEFGKHVVVIDPTKVLDEDIFADDEADLVSRSPIVTVLGHVDHGKTSLLDRIRHSSVADREAGGITQHIGAYQAEINGKKITFLDTPGHAAFTAMRARGAHITDVAVLVVAADDGVMPQTIEAISHVKAAGVPLIVAVNKCDKPDANPDRVLQQLTEYELVPEMWGGDTICVNVSALTGANIEELLESILLVAELAELKANPDRPAVGTVVESEIDKGRGRVCTVIVQTGTLQVGDSVVAGMHYGKIKALVDYKGRRVDMALPSTPVEIVGMDGLPEPGDRVIAYTDDRRARQIALTKQEKAREQELAKTQRMTLDDLFAQMKAGEQQELNIVLKADVQGSVEAIKGTLAKVDIEDVAVKVIHSGVGAINDTDVMLATASNAIIIGFNVRAESSARRIAENEAVELRFYRVIYNLVEDIEKAAKGLLKPEFEEVVIGQAEIRQTFKVPKIGTIAGCYVTEGVIQRNAMVRVYRQGILVHEGHMASLKRFKDDAKEVNSGYECGIGVENYNDIKEGDIIEAYIMKEVKRA